MAQALRENLIPTLPALALPVTPQDTRGCPALQADSCSTFLQNHFLGVGTTAQLANPPPVSVGIPQGHQFVS